MEAKSVWKSDDCSKFDGSLTDCERTPILGRLEMLSCNLGISQDFGAILRSPGNLVAIQFDFVDCSRKWRQPVDCTAIAT